MQLAGRKRLIQLSRRIPERYLSNGHKILRSQ
jgi:hypothetical protein